MPFWLQYIDFAIGIVGLALTVWTLVTTKTLKKRLIYQSEYDNFKEKSEKIKTMLQANICSIRDDKLYLTDENNSFRERIRNQIFSLKSEYSFFSRHTQKFISKVLRLLDAPRSLSAADWRNIADNLNLLMDELQREVIK